MSRRTKKKSNASKIFTNARKKSQKIPSSAPPPPIPDGYRRVRIQALRGSSDPPASSTEVYDARSPRTLANFRLAYEGECLGTAEGQGGRTHRLTFDAPAVRRVGEGLRAGTPIYRGHQSRRQIGSVVGSYMEEGETGLASFVIGRFPGGMEHDIDICSIEADIEVDTADDSTVLDVTNVTGIAVESSQRERPGFSNAKLLGSMTFSQPADRPGDSNTSTDGGGDPDEPPRSSLSDDLDQIAAGIRAALCERQASERRGGWADRLPQLLPEHITQQQRLYLESRFASPRHAEMDDDVLRGHIDEALRDEYPAVARMFGEGHTHASPPMERETTAATSGSGHDNAWLTDAMAWIHRAEAGKGG